MHGDILLMQRKHIKAADNIVGRILQDRLNKFIVAISRESGSGKSEIAHLISKSLKDKGILAKILHTDKVKVLKY